MPPEPLQNPGRLATTGSWRSAIAAEEAGGSSDARTVRSGGSDSGVSGRPPEAPPVPFPVPGQRIDSFDLEAAIGSGGMGAVFRARDTRLDRVVALKILPPDQAQAPEVVQRFYQEARAAARLDHENIARVYTIGYQGGYHYIAFEFIDGMTIRQRVERGGPLPVGEAINFTLQIAGALVHAAGRAVVHRDIKPSNIIVTPLGRAKLVDMGLARRFERGGDDGLTQSGMTLGTFDYISPEQARDPRSVDIRSDLYSLGCTLFHMLTGRPPFPEGTVLQKLLQHQEDPPPDIRVLNPAVPAELASILARLMAKDPDRRYQTPEQLVRDLLTVAGALGLRSISPEGLVWMGPAPGSGWLRHLVWGLPAAVLAAVVAALVWWGNAEEPGFPEVVVGSTGVLPAPGKGSATAPRSSPTPAPVRPRTPAEKAESPAQAARIFAVKDSQELAAALAKAPPRSTVLLTEDSIYEVVPATPARASASVLVGRDLTVKADPERGVHPILRASRPLSGTSPGASDALFVLRGGRVEFEGLEFQLDPGERPDPPTAILAVGTDLRLRRCTFRVAGSRPLPAVVAAVRVRGRDGPGDAEAPRPVRFEACHLAVGQVAILAEGPVVLGLLDCTIAAGESAFWFANARAGQPVPVTLDLTSVSLMAGNGPVFRFLKTVPRVRVQDSVVAPPRDGDVTLVESDEPEALDWSGTHNLYAKVRSFLQPTGGAVSRSAITRFDSWAKGDALREAASVAVEDPVWEEPDPQSLLARDRPSLAFRVGLESAPQGFGARRGPWGPITSPAERMALKATPAPQGAGRAAAEAQAMARTGPAIASETGRNPAPGAKTERVAPRPSPPASGAEDPTEMPQPMGMPPPMERPNPGAAVPPAAGPAEGQDPPVPVPQGGELAPADQRPEAGSAPGSGAGPERAPVIQTSDQFRKEFRRLGPKGGTLRIAAGADLELPGCVIRGQGRWSFVAEPGDARPVLRLGANRREADQPAAPALLFRIRSGGSLKLEGVDLRIPRSGLADPVPSAVFGLTAGTSLELNRCSVTVEEEGSQAAVVAVEGEPTDFEAGFGEADPSAAQVRMTDCVLRSEGRLVEVASGRHLELGIENAAIATRESAVVGHGAPRGQVAEPIHLELQQVTARVPGGLVALESTPATPSLPKVDVLARDSIFATTPAGDPLIRIGGQGGLEALRDLLRWEGHGTGYHLIHVYRRDQSDGPGGGARDDLQADWETAESTHEDRAIHGDLKFARPWEPDRPASAVPLDNFRLAPDSPAHVSGADLGTLPPDPAPPVES